MIIVVLIKIIHVKKCKSSSVKITELFDYCNSAMFELNEQNGIIKDYETQLSNNHQDDSLNSSAATAWQSLKFTSFIDCKHQICVLFSPTGMLILVE
ncbi:hypothetical protein T02_4630 [Trichinella nativa]|uniref:Uncharacterized protein n=1 Tax=Trichinella nativa TaxID=6335 RepID=A0A0V1KXW6_9BILA|nr:hypothetical protein T06_7644 [Trichinella sp. T6]KRZ52017.1 hypothetical protein T02_4630 [Trichinella nativa]